MSLCQICVAAADPEGAKPASDSCTHASGTGAASIACMKLLAARASSPANARSIGQTGKRSGPSPATRE